MSQNPLKSLKRREPRARASFPDPLYDEIVLQPSIGDEPRWMHGAVLDVYLAHAIMLAEQRIVDDEGVVPLLAAFAPELAEDSSDLRTVDDIGRHIAEATHGAATLASAREEVVRTATLMVLRTALLDTADSILAARDAIAQQAAANLNTIALATAHGQSVQPTTLGHYLAGQLGPLARASRRIADAFERVNQSPLGALSGMSTAMPIDRERTARLLGFDSCVDSTLDAIASWDVLLEPLAMLAIAAGDTLRLVADLAYWARDDVGFVTPSDAFVLVDQPQPQRRDPLVLDHLRIRLHAHMSAFSALATLLAGGQMLGSSAEHDAAAARTVGELREAVSTYRLLTRVVESLVVNRAASALRVNRGFATSSELVDLLIVDFGLSPAEARGLTEHVVVDALQAGIDFTTIKPEMVERVAMREIGREIGIEPEVLSRCLAPKRFLERRTGLGGPAPSAVSATLERSAFAARKDAAWVRDRRQELSSARESLWARRQEIISNPASVRVTRVGRERRERG